MLWNIFFKDVGNVMREQHFEDVTFADDSNGMRSYLASTNENFIYADMRHLQQKLHQWGEQIESFSMHPKNRTIFCREAIQVEYHSNF